MAGRESVIENLQSFETENVAVIGLMLVFCGLSAAAQMALRAAARRLSRDPMEDSASVMRQEVDDLYIPKLASVLHTGSVRDIRGYHGNLSELCRAVFLFSSADTWNFGITE